MFNPRKETFQRELQEPLAQLVLVTTDLLPKARIPLRADPKRSVFRLAKGMGSHGLSQKDSADCCADQDEDPGSCLPDLQTGKQNESECQALR
jgi:hypothetical protein